MITVVSGLPRSGTSLMMQMLVAGGLSALTDGLRSADENNPKGYFEWEPAKSLKQNPEAIAAGEGKVVKIISALLAQLPETHRYRVVFMIRPLKEVVSSQNRMLERLGKEVPRTPSSAVIAAFQKHLREVDGWLSNKPYLSVLRVEHSAVLRQPREESARLAEFIGPPLKVVLEIDQVRIGFVDGNPTHCLIDRRHLEAGDGDQAEDGDEAADDGPFPLDENAKVFPQR